MKVLKKLFSPSSTTVLRTFHPPGEIMRRLSQGIESPGEGRTKKPYFGELEKMSFRFETKSPGEEVSIHTRGKISVNSGGNRIEMITEFGSDEKAVQVIVAGVFLFMIGLDFVTNGPRVLWMYAGILAGIVLLQALAGAAFVKSYAQQHLQFIRTALETKQGFNLAEYKREKWKDALALGGVAVVCIAIVVFVTVKYILPLADGVK